MSGYDCQNKCVSSFHQNTVNDEADVMLSGRLFHSFGPAEANDHSPTVTRCYFCFVVCLLGNQPDVIRHSGSLSLSCSIHRPRLTICAWANVTCSVVLYLLSNHSNIWK